MIVMRKLLAFPIVKLYELVS
ncbi:hypothetical protein PT2222_180119 [Paraburkholderia tropica]